MDMNMDSGECFSFIVQCFCSLICEIFCIGRDGDISFGSYRNTCFFWGQCYLIGQTDFLHFCFDFMKSIITYSFDMKVSIDLCRRKDGCFVFHFLGCSILIISRLLFGSRLLSALVHIKT